MSEAMKQAWLEVTQMLDEPTEEDLDVFLRAWQRAIQAEREACARVCDARALEYDGFSAEQNASEKLAAAIRARGNT